jgi:AcrR family transcriptional regulator
VRDLPRNKYPEETVKTILDAALKLFLEKGYEKTTILDIAGEMKGLTRGAFYHHFKSKEEVMFALNDRLFNAIAPFEKVKLRNDLNGLEKIKWALNEINNGGEDYKKIQMQMLPLLNSPTFLKRVIDENRDYASVRLAELIEEGIADGSIKAKYPKLTAELIILIGNFWTIPTVYPQGNLEEALQRVEMVKEITAFLGVPVIDDDLFTFAVMDEDGVVKEITKEEAAKIDDFI